MKDKIYFIFGICCFFLIFIIPEKSFASELSTINLEIGEEFTINDFSKPEIVIGTAIMLEDGVIKARKIGKAYVIYIGKDGSLYSCFVNVIKPEIIVTMLDIGQGDAFLIRVREKSILLDTGERKYYQYLKKQLSFLGVSKIDILIISHMDTDHMGAATLAIQDYNIDLVIIPRTPGESEEYNKLISLMNREDIIVDYAEDGEIISLTGQCLLYILATDLGEGTNDSSIVMKLTFYNNSFLFTGDASASILNKVMDENDISADVIKISHHGSDYSNPLLFLKNVGARIALISVGRNNSYGHPSKNVIRRLDTLRYDIYRTDINGMVTVKGDGDNLSVSWKKIVDWNAEDRLRVDNGPIIGNINSKVYHSKDCISLPASHNRIFFLCEEDAEEAGYRPCNMCMKLKKAIDENHDQNRDFFSNLINFIKLLKREEHG